MMQEPSDDDSAVPHRTAAVVLGAGKGERMNSRFPKVLHRIGNRPMVLYPLDAVRAAGAGTCVVVAGPDMAEVAAAVAPVPTTVQAEPRGTADAVKAARGRIGPDADTVLILYGDTPLVRPQTLEAMIARRREGSHAIVVLGFRPADPGGYGRLVRGGDGSLEAIVEATDASAEQRRVGLCNSGVMAVDGAILFDLVDAVHNDNAKGEYYLTDIVGIARRHGRTSSVIEAGADELLGINSREELAAAERIFQQRMRRAAMAGGATLTDPDSVWFSYDTVLGRDVTVGPQVVFGQGVVVGDDVEIRGFCHIEGAALDRGATVGPFARLRPGAELREGAKVGNFVEVKNAVLKPGARANHLAYIGDAEIGAGANIGAGTITCNYDGFRKARTVIGDRAFIGSNSALVAPVTIGERAIVGAGSTIDRDVEADALALTRAELTAVPGAAEMIRRRKTAGARESRGGKK
ncbi:MAG: bifunctional UDP-N-acetylglucosamine diphosphorylase/glucosamine-1-phosphate N-acetyltransferase GlmU [Rhodospirillaceae bacterium]|nr:bifunctional UDP-N-acetylglucosamine diphosphorylase/glucosamine-1-phosphate N-acetyltransferase GlmU [Rhodospirillaceae bacterium]